jgi:hypothetical protein
VSPPRATGRTSLYRGQWNSLALSCRNGTGTEEAAAAIPAPRAAQAARGAQRQGQQAALVITDEMRRKVENLVAADFSTIEIAAALDISTASLEKHFREELVGGRNKVHADIAHGILQGARDGEPWEPMLGMVKRQCPRGLEAGL